MRLKIKLKSGEWVTRHLDQVQKSCSKEQEENLSHPQEKQANLQEEIQGMTDDWDMERMNEQGELRNE